MCMMLENRNQDDNDMMILCSYNMSKGRIENISTEIVHNDCKVIARKLKIRWDANCKSKILSRIKLILKFVFRMKELA